MSEYITNEEFIKAQDLYNNETDEKKANEILKNIFWPYLKNLAFCMVRKILTQREVIDYYTIEDIDEIATDVVIALVNRYVTTKQHQGRYWNKNHQLYRKNLPKTMVFQCAILKISEHKTPEYFSIEDYAKTYDTFEDDMIEKLSKEGY